MLLCHSPLRVALMVSRDDDDDDVCRLTRRVLGERRVLSRVAVAPVTLSRRRGDNVNDIERRSVRFGEAVSVSDELPLRGDDADSLDADDSELHCEVDKCNEPLDPTGARTNKCADNGSSCVNKKKMFENTKKYIQEKQ